MKLLEFIKKMNLIMTRTITNTNGFCYAKETNKDVDYSESINLIDLINNFNDAYQSFINDFKNLPSLDFLGKKIEYYHSYSKDNIAILYLIINEPNRNISDKPWCYLEITKYSNGNIKCITTNEIKWNNKNRKEIQINSIIANAYLSLIEKHIHFLTCYEELRNKVIVGNGSTLLISNISGEVFESLNKIKLSFGNTYFDSEDIFEISLQLGKPLQISFSESSMHSDNIDEKEIKNKIDTINLLLKELYINLTYLPQLFQNKDKNITRIRKKAE